MSNAQSQLQKDVTTFEPAISGDDTDAEKSTLSVSEDNDTDSNRSSENGISPANESGAEAYQPESYLVAGLKIPSGKTLRRVGKGGAKAIVILGKIIPNHRSIKVTVPTPWGVMLQFSLDYYIDELNLMSDKAKMRCKVSIGSTSERPGFSDNSEMTTNNSFPTMAGTTFQDNLRRNSALQGKASLGGIADGSVEMRFTDLYDLVATQKQKIPLALFEGQTYGAYGSVKLFVNRKPGEPMGLSFGDQNGGFASGGPSATSALSVNLNTAFPFETSVTGAILLISQIADVAAILALVSESQKGSGRQGGGPRIAQPTR